MRLWELFGWPAPQVVQEDGRIVQGVNTTCDVGVDEIIRQAAKFGNAVDRDGRPLRELMKKDR